MKKIFLLLSLIFVANLAAKDVTGNQEGVWKLTDSPVRIVGDVTIQAGDTLTIEPGVIVNFSGDVPPNWLSIYRINIYGTLLARGTFEDSIIFKHETSGRRHSSLDILDATTVSVFEYCRIQDGGHDNVQSRGGAIFVQNSSPLIKNCTFYNNYGLWGGAVYLLYSSAAIIESNLFLNNHASNLGGAVGCNAYDSSYSNTPMIRNNIFVSNSDTTYGGGALSFYTHIKANVINNVFYNNHVATGSGGAILLYERYNNVNVSNCVFWGNTAGSPGSQIYVAGTDTLNIDYSNIEGGATGIAGTGLINYGSHNINNDPLFTNPGGNDFQFEANSPLLDAGTSTAAPATDFYGNARPFDGDRDNSAEYDIGAYEYQNTAPQITSTAVLNATEDVAYSYQVVASDPDYGDDLTYSLPTAPAFLTINPSTGLISGTPANEDVGSRPVIVRVVDLNDAPATQPYTLTITNVNDPPVVADIPNQTINEGATFTTINLDNYVSDVDNTGAQIDWGYSGNVSLIVDINPSMRRATISTPDANWFGNETITFTATDPGLLTDNDAAAFIVRSVNDAPVAVNDAVTTDEDTPVVIDVLDNDGDVDGTLIVSTVTPTDPPHGSATVNPSTGVITYSPDANYGGSDSFTYTVRDDSNAVSNVATVNVTVNPVNDAPVVTDILNQSVAEGSSFATINLDDHVSDAETADADIIWTYSGNTDLTVSIVNRVVTITAPNGEWNGSETITFRATDLAGSYDTDAAMFTVTMLSDAPVVSDIPNQSIAEGSSFTAITLDNYVSDVDNSDAEMTWSYSGNTDLTVSIVNRVATISPANGEWNGSETITFRATDPDNLFDSDEATFTVTAVNDAPVLTDIPNQIVTEGGGFVTITLDNYVSDTDNSDAQMTWTYSGNADLTVSIANRLATISTPSGEWNGSETITFRATDPDELYDSADATFTVTAVNDAPVAVNDAGTTDEDTAVEINVLANDSDIDGVLVPSSVTVSSSPAYGNTTINTISGAIIYTPANNYNGGDSFTYTVHDDSNAVSNTATVTVSVDQVNDAPVISALPELSFNEDDSLLYTFAELYENVTDADTPDSLLMPYSSTGKYITVREDPLRFVFKAGANWFGQDTLEIVVSDGELADTAAVSITVQALNDAPVFINLPDTVKFHNEESEILVMSDYVEDADLPQDSLRWQFAANNAALQMQFNAATAELTLSAPEFTGIISLRFIVTDDGGAEAVVSVPISVTAGPSGILPDLALIPRQHELYQNYPNPFNPLTRIRFGLPYAGRVKIEIYNILGQRVGVLLDEVKQPGYHIVEFNAANLGSGLYFYRLQTDTYNKVMKMVLLK